MVKAIAVDLGGVLFSNGSRVAMERLFADHNYKKEVILKLFSSEECAKLRKGLMADDEFWSWTQKQIPGNYQASIIQQYWYDGYELDKEVFDILKSLKGKYSLIAFSGNVKTRVDYLENKYHFRYLFDKEIYSFDYHQHKYDSDFFETLIKESGFVPNNIVYIDDNEKFIKESEKFGLIGLIYARGQGKKLREDLKNLQIDI